ncbi:MAG: hypothetical protein EU541_03255 [Promethearchaeota archaeon]|nr:MAG: hypothetical protein EU541_03255 [Candidatus Lokiarchaeota archaeon]
MEDIIHPKELTDDPEWNESYYLAFYDKSQQIGGVSRLGFKPNKKESMTFFFLFLPDGSAGGYFQEKKLKEFTHSLNVSGMSHKWNPDGTWNYTFKGNMIIVKDPNDLPTVRKNPSLISSVKKAEMELKFTPINEVYEYSEYMTKESLELGKKAGDKHWEQVANISGKLIVGEEEYTFNNIIGQRDHTYGVRDWTGVGNWLYYVIWFNEQLTLNPAAIVSEDGRLSTGGFIFKDGKNIPLKTITILEQNFDKDGMPINSKLELEDYNGEIYILKANTGPIIPVPFEDKEGNESVLVQSFGEFELNDIKGGFGTFETLRKD